MTIRNEATSRAKDRLDLVKRFFSVAISIGVGSAIVSADWIKNGYFPDREQTEQLCIVLFALGATVLSWDGYLSSVEKKPLNGWFRFAIDIFLVIIYTVLIITAKKTWFWLPILCLIFALYVVWDSVSVLEYPADFDCSYRSGDWRLITVLRVYALAAIDRPGINRGPLISLVWAIYFLVLRYLVHERNPQLSVFWVLSAAAAGLFLYRRDKERTGADRMRGFKMWQRVLIILGLVVCALILPQVKITV
jgi:hypothetical protein